MADDDLDSTLEGPELEAALDLVAFADGAHDALEALEALPDDREEWSRRDAARVASRLEHSAGELERAARQLIQRIEHAASGEASSSGGSSS